LTKPVNPKPANISPRAEYLIERHGSIWLVWILLLFMSWTRSSASLLRSELASNDDYMRMVEVRDWLGGQNWFDMHQYRLNPVDPLYSHWSRISDILIGGPIKLLTPIFGASTAELITVIAYPSILLLVYLYLASALTGLLIKNRATAVITAFMLALTFGALSQFGMGRIDHHGLQIVMALATCWFIVTSTDKPKHLIYAGILCGLALYIGIESAPYVAAACIAVVLIWVFDEPAAAQKLRYFGLALAATTVISLLLSAPPARWFTPSCDALSVVYTQLTLLIAVILWGLSFTSNKFNTPLTRFLCAGVLGAVALIATLVLYPHCITGPYADLDPRLVEIWLSNVGEAGSFMKTMMDDVVTGSAAIIVTLLAVAGYLFAAKKDGKALALTERTLILFILMTLLAGLVQTRLMFFAAALSIPLAAYLLLRALAWAGKFTPKASAFAVRACLLIALSPVAVPGFLHLIVGGDKTTDQSPGNNAATNSVSCITQPVLNTLNALPPGTALTQIDLGAPILNFTKLSVTSAPYHRNASGILAALDMFIEDEQTAKQAIINMKADYVIACTDSGETNMMLKYGPDGMLARLKSGNPPAWLEKVDIDSNGVLLVYRVKLANLNIISR